MDTRLHPHSRGSVAVLRHAPLALTVLTLLGSLDAAALTILTTPPESGQRLIATLLGNQYVTGTLTVTKPAKFGSTDATLNLSHGNLGPFGGALDIFLNEPGTQQASFASCGPQSSTRCDFAYGFAQQLTLTYGDGAPAGSGSSTIQLDYKVAQYANMTIVPVVQPNGIDVLAFARGPAGAITLEQAAISMGYDHFNWLQKIVYSDDLSFCRQFPIVPVCGSFKTITGSVPTTPVDDPAPGGWAYQGASPGNPVRDMLPFYWDEQFGSAKYPGTGREVDAYYVAIVNNNMVHGASPAFLGTAFEFQDAPSVHFGTTVFETSLVGVGCAITAPASCNSNRFEIIDKTQFKWSAVSVVGISTRLFAGDVSAGALLAQVLDAVPHFASDVPGDVGFQVQHYTGQQLANFFIPLDQFLLDTGLTPDVLAAINGGISDSFGELDPLDATNLQAFLASPPVLQSAASSRVHGAAGTFNLPLSLVSTAPTVEPRQGPAQTIVFTFDKAITSATVAISEGTATAGTPTFSGNDVIVGLTGVTNQQYVTVTLTNVAAADGSSGGSGSVRIGFLLGDVNQNGVVTVSDLAQVNTQVAQAVTSANYLKDINASGTLSVADKGIANTQVTKALPAP